MTHEPTNTTIDASDLPRDIALQIIHSKDTPYRLYETVLRSLVGKPGFDINADNGILLTTALANNYRLRVNLLFSLGAMTANCYVVYNNRQYSHAYAVDRGLYEPCAAALLDHTLNSPHFDTVIVPFIQAAPGRLNVFISLYNDAAYTDKLVELYGRCKCLPVYPPGDAILRMCGEKYDLWYPDRFLKARIIQEQKLAETRE